MDVIPQTKKHKKQKEPDLKENFLQKAVEHLEQSKTQTKDEAATFSEYWACLFRKLSETQQLYARKAIEEILLLGQLNQLTLNTVSTASSNVSSNLSSRASTPHSLSTVSPMSPIPVNPAMQINFVPLPVHTPRSNQFHTEPQYQPPIPPNQPPTNQQYENVAHLLRDYDYQ